MQNDISTQKQKLKTKNNLVLQQEQAINEHLDQIDKLNKNVSECKSLLQLPFDLIPLNFYNLVLRDQESKELKLKDQDMLINDLRMKIQESQKTIEANQSSNYSRE